MRKVIQILAIPEDEDNYGTMYVLLDNGEIWSRRFKDVLQTKTPSWVQSTPPPPCVWRFRRMTHEQTLS